MPLNEVHMIYTVECSFTDPTAEDGWNVFYSDEKLPALISVRGFLTSQRFKLSEGTRSAPTYMEYVYTSLWEGNCKVIPYDHRALNNGINALCSLTHCGAVEVIFLQYEG